MLTGASPGIATRGLSIPRIAIAQLLWYGKAASASSPATRTSRQPPYARPCETRTSADVQGLTLNRFGGGRRKAPCRLMLLPPPNGGTRAAAEKSTRALQSVDVQQHIIRWAGRRR